MLWVRGKLLLLMVSRSAIRARSSFCFILLRPPSKALIPPLLSSQPQNILAVFSARKNFSSGFECYQLSQPEILQFVSGPPTRAGCRGSRRLGLPELLGSAPPGFLKETGIMCTIIPQPQQHLASVLRKPEIRRIQGVHPSNTSSGQCRSKLYCRSSQLGRIGLCFQKGWRSLRKGFYTANDRVDENPFYTAEVDIHRILWSTAQAAPESSITRSRWSFIPVKHTFSLP